MHWASTWTIPQHGTRWVGEENGDAQRHFLAGVRRQTERQQTEHVQRDARQDDVEHVVENAALQSHVNRDVRVNRGSDRIAHFVANYPGADERPLAVRYVVGHVDQVAAFYDVHLHANEMCGPDASKRYTPAQGVARTTSYIDTAAQFAEWKTDNNIIAVWAGLTTCE